MIQHLTMHRKKALRVTHGFEPTHASLSFPGRLMRILRSIVQSSALSVFDHRYDLIACRRVARKLVRDYHPWTAAQAFEQLPQEALRRLGVAPLLHQHSKRVPVLVHGTP